MTNAIPSAGARQDLPGADEPHDAGMAWLRGRVPEADPLAALLPAMHRLEAISLSAILSLLASSGALTARGETRSLPEVAAALRAAPRHEWLVRQWLDALGGPGMAVRADSRLYWHGHPLERGAVTDLEAAYAALGFPPAMATCHRAALDRLGALVRDEISIQHLLFRDGQVIPALAAYQDNLFTAYLNAACARLVRLGAQALGAPGRAARVVELGAGAGLTTTAACRTLGGVPVDYLFTDISRIFTVEARERFAGHPGMRFGLLDIDLDFIAQGVDSQSADIVLAGNVLHNAKHVGRTLRHIRGAIVRGGWLVFTESTRESPAVLTSMQFLLSPPSGAPLRGHGDRRAGTDQVFVDTPGWNAELLEAGFLPQFTLPEAASPLAAAGQTLFFAVAA